MKSISTSVFIVLLATLTKAQPPCVRYDPTVPFDACFGGCETYAIDAVGSNYPHCNADSDFHGTKASEACEECGQCQIITNNNPNAVLLQGACELHQAPEQAPNVTCAYRPSEWGGAGFGGYGE